MKMAGEQHDHKQQSDASFSERVVQKSATQAQLADAANAEAADAARAEYDRAFGVLGDAPSADDLDAVEGASLTRRPRARVFQGGKQETLRWARAMEAEAEGVTRVNLDAAGKARAAATRPEASDAARAAAAATAMTTAAAATAAGKAAGRKAVESGTCSEYLEPVVSAAVFGREKTPRTKAVIEDELRARGETPSGEYRADYAQLKSFADANGYIERLTGDTIVSFDAADDDDDAGAVAAAAASIARPGAVEGGFVSHQGAADGALAPEDGACAAAPEDGARSGSILGAGRAAPTALVSPISPDDGRNVDGGNALGNKRPVDTLDSALAQGGGDGSEKRRRKRRPPPGLAAYHTAR